MTVQRYRNLADQFHLIVNRIIRSRMLVIFAAILTLLILISAFSVLRFLGTPNGTGKVVRIFNFSSGYTMNKIADELSSSRIIANGTLFSLYARLKGADEKIQAGTYQFSDAMAPSEILRKLVSGEVFEREFVVPEGYSIFQIAELLERQDIFPKKSFLKECRNQSLLDELHIPAASVEGFLYPSTYRIRNELDEAGFIKEMVARFREVYSEKFAQREQSSKLSLLQIVTLASIIEKEAVIPEERPVIASVFLNRLGNKMPLQSDPTAVYGIRAFAGKVSKQDILRETPYNTYCIKGLPPGPIGNPGEAAIEAVLSPAPTSYLYFVARKDGSHQFSTTLAEHNKAVDKFLRTTEQNRQNYRSDTMILHRKP